MRKTWTTLIASIGLLLTGLAAPVLLGPADAATAPTPDVAPASGSAAILHARGTKPTRNLHDSIVKKRGKLYFTGRVDPGHGPVVVQKKTCASKKCTWRAFKKVRTHGPKEKWQVRVFAPRHGNWYWRGYVKAYGGYAKSWTHTYKTYVTRL